ncbi:MAG TPA: serine hydrolase [Thiobacillus sp.]|nr:serine hydrolase [Gammaproteobacteria bacterium]OYZ29928.1 MAG: D-alanyl-D-alanine carboxypeptidase [Hydrogenophilales bacterium 16-64-40]OZA35301.1 MAG: D-alanyl-D-alanine carboxypeptidase [Hydrogenophilales bacterium 17-64-65]HQS83119.1 serine hydrolase [Thiobacillus sp.]HQT33724.1 serine hydrolase [Thiobacillus sp.]
MKAVLSGLLLLCVHTGAAALDGRTAPQWGDQLDTTLSAPQPAPKVAPMPEFSAHSVLVFDQASGQPLLAKNANLQTPIASITKLMTAMLVLNAGQPLDELIAITEEDRDTLKGTGSRLAFGSRYTRGQLLHLALIASDNRAANALGRNYPGGLQRFVATMNRTARVLGMNDTVYVEPTGLSSGNRSTAHDLAKLVNYAYQNYPEIRHISTAGNYTLDSQRVVTQKKQQKPQVHYRTVAFNNTNRFTRADDWHIGLSKTGFINEAGHCLIMQAQVANRDVIIVLLDARGTGNRASDATRIKEWLESATPLRSDNRNTAASRT